MEDGRLPLWILCGLIVVWSAVMGALIVMRHERFGTFGFDEGIFDQFLWLLSEGQQFNTVRGVTLAGHHASFAFLALAPLVWLGGSPNTWNVLHAVAIAATALPLYLLVRDKIGPAWIGLVVGVVWLAQPTAQWLVWEGFHPEGMALPFLVGAYAFGERYIRGGSTGVATARSADPGVIRAAAPRQLRSSAYGSTGVATAKVSLVLFSACFLLAITWKEDVALALVGMGVVWIIRGRWRFGLAVAAAAGAWFVIFGMWLVPMFAEGTVYSGIYGDLGRTPGEIVANSVTDPGALVQRMADNGVVSYTAELTRSWAFVPFLAPSTLLIGAPQWFTNIISAAGFTYDTRLHYTAIPLAALGISFVEGIRRALRWSRPLGTALLALGLVSALLFSHWDGPSPLGRQYDLAWPTEEPSDMGARQHALALVPGGAGVSVDYRLTSHMTHREVVYEFPNPWRSWNYGVEPGDRGDPSLVDWVIVDTKGASAADAALVEDLMASDEMAVRFSQDGIVVLERVAPPGG